MARPPGRRDNRGRTIGALNNSLWQDADQLQIDRMVHLLGATAEAKSYNTRGNVEKATKTKVDAVGLGKTLEAGVLLSELIRRGKAKRILVVAVKSMLTQFQKELWSRFAIPLVRLDSEGLKRIRERVPVNHNPFHYYDQVIISVDTLKQSNWFRTHLEASRWDVIVIDEAHNVAERGTNSQRSKLARTLASRSDALIMLSATPHDGRARSFASLMNMLDPTAIANPEQYTPDEIRGLFIRRFKKDIKDQVASAFPERVIKKLLVQASAAEEAAYEALGALSLKKQGRQGAGGTGMLFKTLLEKSLFSSPAACLQTVTARIKKLEPDAVQGDADANHDLAALRGFEAVHEVPFRAENMQ